MNERTEQIQSGTWNLGASEPYENPGAGTRHLRESFVLLVGAGVMHTLLNEV